MTMAKVNGVNINYEIVGDHGPWVALMPGGRRAYDELLPLARRIADGGYRVVLHDRRNTGRSDVVFDDSDAEDALWAEDLHALLGQLGALPCFVGGSSSGCRTALLFYLRHRADVRGLLLFRITGGAFAAQRLPENYYAQFIRAAEQGGMLAVSRMDHWHERMALNPRSRAAIMNMSAARFIAVMTRWQELFLRGADMPVLGISAEELRAIAVPAIVIPGNDRIHSSAAGKLAHSLIPGAVLHSLPIADSDADLVPFDQWAPYEPEMAQAFIGFMRGAEVSRAAE